MSDTDQVSKVGTNYTHVTEIAFRFDGAVYFYEKLKDKYEYLKNRPVVGTGEDIKKLHWYYHAYCFELVATFDTALQVLCAHLNLDIPRRRIFWKSVKKALKAQGYQDDFTDLLDEIQGSDWFNNLKDRRNYITHRNSAFIQALVAKDCVQELKILNEVGIGGLEKNLERMSTLPRTAWAHIPDKDLFFIESKLEEQKRMGLLAKNQIDRLRKKIVASLC